ncbi:hypothetical protein JTB14_028699 [Gonioctena quinquepunctata]|nr:hypothetical protein JTB14_028699 [Gonioctena quinquepunctata]
MFFIGKKEENIFLSLEKYINGKSLGDSWENASFETKCSGNIVATDDQELVQIKEEIKEDNANEDNFERTDDLLTINADLTMQTLKFEDEIDIVYEDNKPEIHGDRLSGNKSHPNTIIAKIVPRESAIDSWKNTNFDTKGSEHIFAADDQELAQIKKEIKEDNANEDNFECTDYLLKINVDLKMQAEVPLILEQCLNKIQL